MLTDVKSRDRSFQNFDRFMSLFLTFRQNSGGSQAISLAEALFKKPKQIEEEEFFFFYFAIAR